MNLEMYDKMQDGEEVEWVWNNTLVRTVRRNNTWTTTIVETNRIIDYVSKSSVDGGWLFPG
jgi:hypothetical protein